MHGFWSDFKDWVAHPFSEDMPMLHWFYLIGMLIVFIVLWNIILSHLLGALSDA